MQYSFPEQLCVTLEKIVWYPVLMAFRMITRHQLCFGTIMNKIISIQRAVIKKQPWTLYGENKTNLICLHHCLMDFLLLLAEYIPNQYKY